MRDDFLVFTPDDVDLARSPLRAGIDAETFVLGAFNPGLARLPNGNLMMMVRVAEALRRPFDRGFAHAIRWTPDGYVLDRWPVDQVSFTDPRVFTLRDNPNKPFALTSLSWLLPVELSGDGERVVDVHYDRIIAPGTAWQQYGLEDPRLSLIGGRWYMTACCVSSQRHCTGLWVSVDGRAFQPLGIVLDHQNKDMVLFEGKPGGQFVALTRPLGSSWVASPPDDAHVAGPAIQLAGSPDALHWRPFDRPGIRPRRDRPTGFRIGGGAQPVLTPEGWLVLYHGVQPDSHIGTYRTFWALLDRDDPAAILHQADDAPLIESAPDLTAGIAHQRYLRSPVVFTTGIVDAGDHFLVASGEADLACRLTRIAKSRFS